MRLTKIGSKIFIVVGLVLFVMSGLAYFGILPVLGYVVDWSKPHLSVNFGIPVAYVKIAVNGDVKIEENIGYNFIANRVVNVEVGDIVDIWMKWEKGYSGHVKVKIVKIPSYDLEPNCIEILEISGQGPPGLRHDVLMYVHNTSGIVSEYVSIDIPDAPAPTPVPTPTPTPTITATITSTTATTTVTGTVTLTVTGTSTTTMIAPTTTVEANAYTPNRIISLILGIAGTISMIFGFRRPI